MSSTWTRRGATAATVSGLILSGPVTAAIRPKPKVLINLADLQDLPLAADADPALTKLATSRDAAHRVTAPVFINGKGPYEFVVDTGANRTVVATEVAQTLALPPGPNAEVNGIAGIETAPTSLIDRLDVGRVNSRKLQAPTLTHERLGADGLLGVDVLKNRRLTIDFRLNTITIYRANSNTNAFELRSDAVDTRVGPVVPRRGDYTVVPARVRFGQLIVIDADLGGVPVVAFLDSGSQNTVGNLQLYEKLKRKPELLSPRPLIVQLISATGQTARGEFSRVPALRLGGLAIENISAVFADLHVFKLWNLIDRPAILVGIDVMRHFEGVDLDFAGRKVTFVTPLGSMTPRK